MFVLGTVAEAPASAGVKGLLEGVQTSLLSEISSALPIAGTVFAAIAGIMVGIKLFKRITGARS